MKYIVFDTETTGLPKWRGQDVYKGPRNWPDIVSICWVVLEDGQEVKRRYYIVKPRGWTIPPDSTAIHGISHVQALYNGRDLEEVMTEFKADIMEARWVIAHNLEFDRNVVLNAWYWRLREDPARWWQASKEFCSMLQGARELNMVDAAGRQKWVKLDELYAQSMGKVAPADAHNAERDVNVLIDIMHARNWFNALLLIA
jgi:DNA polymerase-3 subunit alpha